VFATAWQRASDIRRSLLAAVIGLSNNDVIASSSSSFLRGGRLQPTLRPMRNPNKLKGYLNLIVSLAKLKRLHKVIWRISSDVKIAEPISFNHCVACINS